MGGSPPTHHFCAPEVGIPVIRNATRKNTSDPETEMTGFFRVFPGFEKKFKFASRRFQGRNVHYMLAIILVTAFSDFFVNHTR